MDIPASAARVLGRFSRRYRYGSGAFRTLGRASGRGVRYLAPRISTSEIGYIDHNGYVLSADVHDHMELEGFIGLRKLEPDISEHVKPGDWVLDVGANVGLITAELCHLVGPSGRAWAIEPIPRNFRRLHELADKNGLSQLRVIEGALSSETGQATIRLPAEHQSGWASFTKSWGMDGTITTPTWRLDDLVAGEPGRISFLKLDVEGFEPQVLSGASQTLASMRPYVMCEFNDILLRDAGASSLKLLAQFADLGYEPATARDTGPADFDGQVIDILLRPLEKPALAQPSVDAPATLLPA